MQRAVPLAAAMPGSEHREGTEHVRTHLKHCLKLGSERGGSPRPSRLHTSLASPANFANPIVSRSFVLRTVISLSTRARNVSPGLLPPWGTPV